VYWGFRSAAIIGNPFSLFGTDNFRDRQLTKEELEIPEDICVFPRVFKTFAPAIVPKVIFRYDGRYSKTLQLKGGVGKPLTTPLPDYVTISTFSSIRQKGLRLSGERPSLVHQAALGVRKVSPINIYTGKGIVIEGEVISRKAGKEKTSI
jgi:hypothetical protein